MILEITRPQREPLSSFYSMWFDKLVPVLGTFAGDSDAYSYLPESVRTFPEPRELAAKMDAAGFEQIRWLLTAGGHRDPQRHPQGLMGKSAVPAPVTAVIERPAPGFPPASGRSRAASGRSRPATAPTSVRRRVPPSPPAASACAPCWS